jgi:glycosyltransferase involved in cell wall biosynthesis
LRQELGCGGESKLVGMIANISTCKGCDDFIRAARRVADTFPQVRFVSVGDIDPALRQPLFSLVRELGLQNRFFFLGFREDVPEILSELDIFVLSSLSEGLSIATIEAMAAGKPVVVTRSGGPEEIVEDGRTGFLVPPANPDALAERICDVLRAPGRAHAMGLSAQAEVKSRFTLEKMVREYERLYQRLLNSD